MDIQIPTGLAQVIVGAPTTVAAPPGIQREVVAQVLANDSGTLVLRIGRTTIEARSAVDLPVGVAVRLTVLEATAQQVVLSLATATTAGAGGKPGGAGAQLAAGAGGVPPDELTALLTRTLGEAPAAALARLLTRRGADPNEATALAARFLTGDASPVEQLRRLAVRDAKLRDRLAAAERGSSSGDPTALRAAVASLREAGPSGVPPELAHAQRLLDARPGDGAPSLLFLPLPGGSEARVTVEAGAGGERLESFRVGVELSLPKLGELSIEVLGHQGAAFVTIRSEDASVVEGLTAALPELEEAVSSALGLPTRAAALQRAPSRQPIVGAADVYA